MRGRGSSCSFLCGAPGVELVRSLFKVQADLEQLLRGRLQLAEYTDAAEEAVFGPVPHGGALQQTPL